jgi:hypothetical protein
MTALGILCVFAKAPLPGRVKTRLVNKLNADEAATLARALLLDTWQVVESVRAPLKPILVLDGPTSALIPATTPTPATPEPATPEPAAPEPEPPLDPLPEIWPQSHGDLGNRLERAFEKALRQAPWVIAIGTDSPGLDPAWIERAAGQLASSHDAVIGPTRDGGYYLLGLRRCPRGLLADLPWSTSTTFAATLERLHEHGFNPALLPEWFDVDEPSDLDWLTAELAAGRLQARHTARVLAKLRLGA